MVQTKAFYTPYMGVIPIADKVYYTYSRKSRLKNYSSRLGTKALAPAAMASAR